MPEITKKERAWLVAFGEKIGAEPHFHSKWHSEVAQVSFLLRIEKWKSQMWTRDEDGNKVITDEREHEMEREKLKLRKFVGSDCPDGWTAYMYDCGSCYLQGDPEPSEGERPQTPEAAVNEIIAVLRKRAQTHLDVAARLEET